MHIDPIYFKETEGRWIGWAIDKALELYDSYGGSAKVALKCPRLRIRSVRSPKEVARLRASPQGLFPKVKDIDQLLEKGYKWDPWNNVVRRGRIDAILGKR